MSFSVSGAAPPGWYPDPSGSRQWRVWTGTAWSEITRPYGEPVVATRLATNLNLVRALRRVMTWGVIGVVGGFGLLVSTLAHWPATATPTPEWFALLASSVAVALLALGTVACAFGVKELRGRWTVDAVIPGINLVVVSALVAQRLGRPSFIRVTAEVALLVVFGGSLHRNLWLGFAPMIVAFGQTMWMSVFIDRLTGPPPETEAVAP